MGGVCKLALILQTQHLVQQKTERDTNVEMSVFAQLDMRILLEIVRLSLSKATPNHDNVACVQHLLKSDYFLLSHLFFKVIY